MLLSSPWSVLLLVTLAALSSAGVRAQAVPADFTARCEAELAPAVFEVRSEPSQVRYDFGKSVAQLQAMTKAANPTMKTLGLTTTSIKLTGNWTWSTLVLPNGLACLRPSMLVLVSVNPQTVHVAREFPQGTCAFDVIAEHELRHVRTNQSHLERIAGVYQQRISSYYGQRIFYGPYETLKKQATEAFQGHWKTAIERDLEAVSLLHAQIDTPQEYARNDVVCAGEIPRLLRRQPALGGH